MLFLKSKKIVLCSLIIKFSYIFFQRVRTIGFITYGKFRRFVMFHTLVLSGLNFGGRVPLWLQWVQCHHAIVTLCVRNFFWLVIRGSETLSHEYFVVPNFFSWVFPRLNIFSRRYFVGRIFFLMAISCVHFFS